MPSSVLIIPSTFSVLITNNTNNNAQLRNNNGKLYTMESEYNE